MRASSPRRRGTGVWEKRQLDAVEAGEMLRDLAKPCRSNPLTAFAFFNHRGIVRRVIATYEEGWKLQVNFTQDGKVSSYQLGCSMTIVAGPKGGST